MQIVCSIYEAKYVVVKRGILLLQKWVSEAPG
jgi:hypothetical protein